MAPDRDHLVSVILGAWARNIDNPQGNVETLAQLAADAMLDDLGRQTVAAMDRLDH